ncbi:fimbrial protein [Pseudomonas putida]|uniref:fimbrial protein n=2 Tax=Pseudomonas putida group TaxID=136845 RepID=UPI0015999035|nr:fimbrial protein [Pseudomonas putida]QKL09604.1 fimbrial protein [Pseudomonas putida]
MRLLVGLIGIFVLVESSSLWAACKWDQVMSGFRPDPYNSVVVPPSITMSLTPIGGVLASFSGGGARLGVVNCDRLDKLEAILDIKGLEPAGIMDVYKTNVQGVGIRITGYANSRLVWTPPQKTIVYDEPRYEASPTSIKVEYIRTGFVVGSGKVTSDFRVLFKAPGISPSTIEFASSAQSSKLINETYFTSCASTTSNLNVSMGKQQIKMIGANTSPKKDFSFEVRCLGLKPNKPVPIKIYFEGDSPGAGKLNLSGAGQEGVASGVHIALTTNKGKVLPFNKNNSIELEWLRSEAMAEVYRFSGVAQYAPSQTGKLKPGRGDATMTYVLEYN